MIHRFHADCASALRKPVVIHRSGENVTIQHTVTLAREQSWNFTTSLQAGALGREPLVQSSHASFRL